MRVFPLITIATLVGGCVTTGQPTVVPEIGARPMTLESGEVVAPTPVTDATGREPIVQMTRIQYDLPRGKEIFATDGGFCSGHKRDPEYFNGNPDPLRPRDWQRTFQKVMSGHGFRIPNERRQLFSENDADGVDVQIGAIITDMHTINGWTCDVISKRIVGQRGSSMLKLEWQVFDPVKRLVIGRWSGEGKYSADTVLPDDAGLPLQLAFADAVNALAVDPRLRELLTQRPAALASGRGVDAQTRRPLPRQPLFTQGIDAQIDQVRGATVLIETSTGHGSGFLIAPDGLLVTNYHVVRSERFVRVRLLSGQAVAGEVLQRHETRDVALVKIEGTGYPVLPVRETPVRVTEEVYAVGAPRYKQLGWTVTRGVISAWRPARRGQAHDLIQADVAIHGGNSGGPLLDRQGNLVGISVAGIGKDNMSLNLFIPILDALDKLGLDLKDAGESDRRRRTAIN